MATSSETPTVSLREAAELLDRDALFLDVREQGEWDLGHVPEEAGTEAVEESSAPGVAVTREPSSG